MRRGPTIAAALAVLSVFGLTAAACGGRSEVDRVEDAVRDAANSQLVDLETGSTELRVVGVDCLLTTAIQDDVDQYYCDIRVADESGAGFLDRDSEVFYSTSAGSAELLDFPPRSIRS